MTRAIKTTAKAPYLEAGPWEAEGKLDTSWIKAKTKTKTAEVLVYDASIGWGSVEVRRAA